MSKDIDKRFILNTIKELYSFSTDTEFAKFLGIKPQTLSSWYSRNTFDIDLLYAKCVLVSGEFLLTGDKNFLKRNVQNLLHNNSVTNSVTFSEETKSAKNVTLSNESKENYSSLIKEIGVPLIPIDAMAGFGSGATQVMAYDTDLYVIPEFTELNVDFMIRVKGSSMYPKYNSGDLVACKKLNIKDLFFQWNKVYVLDTEQGALIKRIKKSVNGEDFISIVSDNPSYDPLDLHFSKIYAVALVVGVIRLE